MYEPSDKEQEYFLRVETERLKKLREEHRHKQVEEDRRRLQELHFMHCPKCGQAMTTSTLADVEVDLCPDCGGLYLDVGELDKILEEKRRGIFATAVGFVRRLSKE